MKTFSIISLFVGMAALQSCQKVINVNLNDSDPRYILEGNIDDGAGPYFVKLSRSVNFSTGNDFPAVTGAVVTITDVTAGLTDTLHEQAAGTYATSLITGVPGHEYRLYAQTGDHVFTAASIMPLPVDIDSITTEKSVFGGDDLFPVPNYTDPVVTGNNYRITASVNRVNIKDWRVRSDDVTNGQAVRFPFYYDTDDDSDNPKIHPGDSVFVTLQTIDSAVYEFYRTLSDTQEQSAAALSNPITNVKGGAMGYFSAGAKRTKGIKIPS